MLRIDRLRFWSRNVEERSIKRRYILRQKVRPVDIERAIRVRLGVPVRIEVESIRRCRIRPRTAFALEHFPELLGTVRSSGEIACHAHDGYRFCCVLRSHLFFCGGGWPVGQTNTIYDVSDFDDRPTPMYVYFASLPQEFDTLLTPSVL